MDDKDDSTDLECRATRVSGIASIFKSVFPPPLSFWQLQLCFVSASFYFFHPLNRRIASGVNDVIFLSLATSNTLKVFFYFTGQTGSQAQTTLNIKNGIALFL